MDYLRYYDLESFLFDDVRTRLQRDHTISAFDFFSIVIWKANRAKPAVARRLLKHDPKGRQDLDAIVRDLSKTLADAPNAKARLHLLMSGWGFALPMATAILATLWPDDFGVYDVRVCEQLGNFQKLQNRTRFETAWTGYQDYLAAVRRAVSELPSLRDKDRYLWGKSVAQQLEHDIGRNFGVGEDRTSS